jgi:hypothetical protein
MFKNWFKKVTKRNDSDPNQPPTVLSPYLVKTAEPYSIQAESLDGRMTTVHMPRENTYTIPVGDAVVLIIELRELAAKGDYWAKRDLEEIQAGLNGMVFTITITRPY